MGYAVLVLLWFLAFVLLFKPDLLASINFWKEFFENHQGWVTSILLTIFFTGPLLLLMAGFKKYKSYQIQKLNLKKGEVEIARVEETSTLNKFLDEILYLFEETKTKVLVIEDVDRFNDLRIYTTLREINKFINDSQQGERLVVFIYALKDDLFENNTDRTKFFEFIIPVIPVLGSSNVMETLQKEIEDFGLQELFSESFISDVALYISDMRLLINILNETRMYHQHLNKKGDLNGDRLLAWMLYKNLYPEDFADFHKGEGMLADFFTSKEMLIQRLVEQKENELQDLEMKNDAAEDSFLRNARELRSLYLFTFLEGNPQTQFITLERERYSFREIREDEGLFELFREQNDIVWSTSRSYSGNYSGVSFSDLEEQIHEGLSYEDRERIIELKKGDELERLKQRKEQLTEEIAQMKHAGLKELIARFKGNEAFEGSDLEKEALLIFLLRNGYLEEETYASYLYHFHPGTFTEQDRQFLLSIKNRIFTGFTSRLTKVEAVLKRIHLHEFERKEILNIDLLDYLLLHGPEYEQHLKKMLGQIKRTGEDPFNLNPPKQTEGVPDGEKIKTIVPLRFMEDYLFQGKRKFLFIERLSRQWKGFWDFIDLNSGFSTSKKREYLSYILKYAELETIEGLNGKKNLTRAISQKKDFLSLFPGDKYQRKIKEVLQRLKVRFEDLDYRKESKELVEFIYRKNLYSINAKMIQFMIRHFDTKGADKTNELATANYTTIMLSNCTFLQDYIKENLEEYIGKVFLLLESNTKENEHRVGFLLNHKKISLESKKAIIRKQEVVFSDITAIEDKELWDCLLDSVKVQMTWNNILHYYYDRDSITAPLLEVLSKKEVYQELSTHKMEEEDEIEEFLTANFCIELISTSLLPEMSFRSLRKSIPFTYDDFGLENLPKERVAFMIESKLLNLTVENFEALKTHFDGRHIDLIRLSIGTFLENKEDYPVEADDLFTLLWDQALDMSSKAVIIRYWNFANYLLEYPENLPANSALIRDIYLHLEDFEVGEPLLSTLIENSQKGEKELLLLCQQIPHLESEKIFELLSLFDDPYAKIADRKSKPLLVDSIVNNHLMEALKERYLISSQKEKKGTRLYPINVSTAMES